MDSIEEELEEEEEVHIFGPVVVLENDNNAYSIGGTIEEMEGMPLERVEVGDSKGI